VAAAVIPAVMTTKDASASERDETENVGGRRPAKRSKYAPFTCGVGYRAPPGRSGAHGADTGDNHQYGQRAIETCDIVSWTDRNVKDHLAELHD
jgi:hypothetical protein